MIVKRVLVVSVLALTACTSSAKFEPPLAEPSGSLRLAEAELGRTVTVRQGQTLYVELAPNRYKLSWNAPGVSSSDVLTVVAYRHPVGLRHNDVGLRRDSEGHPALTAIYRGQPSCQFRARCVPDPGANRGPSR